MCLYCETFTLTDQVECETHTATNTWRHSCVSLSLCVCVCVCVVAGQRCATLASDPSHTPPQHHWSISHPPPTHALLQECLLMVVVVGKGGRGGDGGVRVSGVILKAVVRTGWKWGMTYSLWSAAWWKNNVAPRCPNFSGVAIFGAALRAALMERY